MKRIDLKSMKNAWAGALRSLSAQEDEINRLNVFPVPDGDTGSNMVSTLRSAVEHGLSTPGDRIDVVLAEVAKAALMGARGNSGVILSQYLRGFSNISLSSNSMSPRQLAEALSLAAEQAYNAVIRPVEGTILTVAKDAGEGAQRRLESGRADCIHVLEGAVEGAGISVEKTPKLLDKLAQAGVVDAGGKGLYWILRGMLEGLKKASDAEWLVAEPSVEKTAPAAEPKAALELGAARYCTEVVVSSNADCAGILQERLSALEVESLLVVAGEDIIKLHAHAPDPGKVISLALGCGELLDVKVDNMARQHRDRIVEPKPPQPAVEQSDAEPLKPPKEIGVVAIGVGEGFVRDLKSFGVDYVVPGGQTMNPSVEDILKAINAVDARSIIVLPNNGNILLTARVAAESASKPVKVVPTRFLLQSIPALLAYNPDMSLEENMRLIEYSISDAEFGEVTYSVRGVQSHEGVVNKGDIIGMVGEEIVSVGKYLPMVVLETIKFLVRKTEDPEILTVYYGSDVSDEDARSMEAEIEQAFDFLDITMRWGGQPHYFFLLMVE